MTSLQFFNREDSIPEGELYCFPVPEWNIGHESLGDIEPTGALGVNEYFPHTDFFHDYTYDNYHINMAIGVNKCKPFIQEKYYIGVNRWSTWTRRRII